MHRRAFIGRGAVVAGAVGLAGCASEMDALADPGGNGGRDGPTAGEADRGPAATVEAFLRAVAAGDRARIEALVHPDGELADRVGEYAAAGGVIFDSVETELADREGDRAFVEAEAVETGADGEVTVDTVYELRTRDGAWRLYADPGRVPLRFRVRDVPPADSYETRIGGRETAAPFFGAADVASVGLRTDRQGLPVLALEFPEPVAERMQETAVDVEGPLRDAGILEYLDGALARSFTVGPGLAERMESGDWLAAPAIAVRYGPDEQDVAERVAATLLARSDG